MKEVIFTGPHRNEMHILLKVGCNDSCISSSTRYSARGWFILEEMVVRTCRYIMDVPPGYSLLMLTVITNQVYPGDINHKKLVANLTLSSAVS